MKASRACLRNEAESSSRLKLAQNVLWPGGSEGIVKGSIRSGNQRKWAMGEVRTKLHRTDTLDKTAEIKEKEVS